MNETLKNFTKKDFYTILEISKDATKSEIKKQYFKLSKKYHPDLNHDDHDATEKFKYISYAYQTLMDEELREKYDDFLTLELDINFEEYLNEYDEEVDELFDPTILDDFIIKNNYGQDLIDFINNLNNNEKIILFEYFWITFWIGNEYSEKLLLNNGAVIIFNIFINDKKFVQWFKSVMHETYDYMDDESKHNFDEIQDAYIEEVTFLTNEIEKNLEDAKLDDNTYDIDGVIQIYNYIVSVINEKNIFDEEAMAYFSLNNRKITIKMFELMSSVFIMCKNYGCVKEISIGKNNKFRISSSQLGQLIFWIIIVVGMVITSTLIAVLD